MPGPNFTFSKSTLKIQKIVWAGERAQWLKALAEDLGSVTSLVHICTASSRESDALCEHCVYVVHRVHAGSTLIT